MAEGFGREGVAVGGKGGMKKGGVYDFGAKSAGEYLSGGIASQYAQAASTLRSDLSSPQDMGVPGQLAAKASAKSSIGKLRDLAEANAVGEFTKFAESKGRASQATASQGLVTGETYAPESTANLTGAANTNYYVVPSKYGKAIAGATGAGAHNLNQHIMGLAAPMEFANKGPVSYAEAAKGQTGALHRKLEAEGQAVGQAKALGDTSGMFAGAAESSIAPLNERGGMSGRQTVSFKKKTQRETQVEQARQSILAMTPAERYLQGIGGS